LVEINDTCFFKTAHALADLEVDLAIVGKVDSALFPDFLRNLIGSDTDVLAVAQHGSAEVAVLDVEAEVAGAFVSVKNGTVHVDLGVQHGDGG
jgi:hypothetical protein